MEFFIFCVSSREIQKVEEHVAVAVVGENNEATEIFLIVKKSETHGKRQFEARNIKTVPFYFRGRKALLSGLMACAEF